MTRRESFFSVGGFFTSVRTAAGPSSMTAVVVIMGISTPIYRILLSRLSFDPDGRIQSIPACDMRAGR